MTDTVSLNSTYQYEKYAVRSSAEVYRREKRECDKGKAMRQRRYEERKEKRAIRDAELREEAKKFRDADKKFSNGQQALLFHKDGSGFAFYPSGRTAVCIAAVDRGFYSYFYDNDKENTCLASFDMQGIGTISYPKRMVPLPRVRGARGGGSDDGRPQGGMKKECPARFVMNKLECTLSDEKGNITRGWRWLKPPANTKIDFAINGNLHFSSENRQNMHVKFRCEDINMDFDVGERIASGSSYLSRVKGQETIGPKKGKFVLDVPSIAIKDSVQKGLRGATKARGLMDIGITIPFQTQNLDTVEKNRLMLEEKVDDGQFLTHAFVDMEVAGVEPKVKKALIMPVDVKGDLAKTIDLLARDGLADKGLANSLGIKMNKESGTRSSNIKPLPVSNSLRAASGRYRPRQLGEGKVESGKKRLPVVKDVVQQWRESNNPDRADEDGDTKSALPKKPQVVKPVTDAEFTEWLLTGVANSELIVICCLADWMPSNRKAELMLEDINGEIYEKKKQGQDLPYRLFKFEMSESRLLTDKYNIRTYPMYLMFYGGKLVYASNIFNGFGVSMEDFFDQCKQSLQNAQRNNFLPPDFKFGKVSDSLHDGMKKRLNNTLAKNDKV